MEIGRNHPLRRLFSELVRRRFFEDVRVRDARVTGYVSGLLTDFTDVDKLYKVRSARGKRLDDVGDMLVESNPLLDASSFDREREVRKHVGDYTLFFAGMFPEYVTSYRRRWKPAPDILVDYVKAGRESYAIVSSFDQFEYREEAPLFRRLSETFELCVYGLHLVKRDLERSQQDYYRRLQARLGDQPPA